MFEREIRFITDITLNNIKKLGSFFTLESLEKAKIHPAIIQYISAELDYLIYLDRQRLLQKSLFDYSGLEINTYFIAISKEIKKNKLIPFEEIRRLVQQAVTFNVNFLLRPHWTLKKFIYDNEEYRSAEELQLFLNYTFFYDFYKQYIIAYLERRKILSLQVNEFGERINLLTKELFRMQFDIVIESSLLAIAEFLNMGEANKTRLNVGMVETFLKDKELNDQVLKIRQILSIDTKQKFDIADFKHAIMSNISVVRTVEIPETVEEEEEYTPIPAAPKSGLQDEATAQPLLVVEEKKEMEPVEIDALFEESEIIPETFDIGGIEEETAETIPEAGENLSHEEPMPEQESASTVSADKQIESEKILEEIRLANEILAGSSAEEEAEAKEDNIFDSFTPPDELEENFQDEVPAAISQPETSDVENSIGEGENALPVDEDEQEEQPLETAPENDEEEKPLQKTTIDDTEEEEVELFSYFSTKETMRIISTVFGNDGVDFVNTIEKIAVCDNFEQASLILKSVFYSYRVNPLQSREAKFLEERIKDYFTEKSS